MFVKVFLKNYIVFGRNVLSQIDTLVCLHWLPHFFTIKQMYACFVSFYIWIQPFLTSTFLYCVINYVTLVSFWLFSTFLLYQKYLVEFIDYNKGTFIRQNTLSELDDEKSVINRPEYIVVFLIHTLAHHQDFPSEDCEDENIYASFCR